MLPPSLTQERVSIAVVDVIDISSRIKKSWRNVIATHKKVTKNQPLVSKRKRDKNDQACSTDY